MPSLEYKGKTYEVDEDGYLLNLDEWNEDIAGFLAEQEEVEMTPAHWEVVNFLRDYYAEYKIAPMIKILVKAIGQKLDTRLLTDCGLSLRDGRILADDDGRTGVPGLYAGGDCRFGGRDLTVEAVQDGKRAALAIQAQLAAAAPATA